MRAVVVEWLLRYACCPEKRRLFSSRNPTLISCGSFKNFADDGQNRHRTIEFRRVMGAFVFIDWSDNGMLKGIRENTCHEAGVDTIGDILAYCSFQVF